MTGVRHRDDASEMPGAMSAGRFALVTASSVVRGETGFGLSCPGDGKQNSSSNQQTSNLSRCCKAIRAKACPSNAAKSFQDLTV